MKKTIDYSDKDLLFYQERVSKDTALGTDGGLTGEIKPFSEKEVLVTRVGKMTMSTAALEETDLSEKEYKIQEALGTLPICVEVISLDEEPFAPATQEAMHEAAKEKHPGKKIRCLSPNLNE